MGGVVTYTVSLSHQDWSLHRKGPMDQARHAQMNLFLSRLDEQQRRWYVALEAERLGHGGERRLAEITGLDEKTIRRGREELAAGLAQPPTDGAGPVCWCCMKSHRALARRCKYLV